MADEINTGGPAYPTETYSRNGYPCGPSMGMTLRDYFAGQALAGLLAGCSDLIEVGSNDMAVNAYMQADAMLRARGAD